MILRFHSVQVHTKTHTTGLVVLAGLLLAFTAGVQTVHAYLTPEEVLLSEELYLPPRTREALDRIDRQQRVSEVRRDREQEAVFPVLAPTEDANVEDEYRTSAPDYDNLDAFDVELLRTLRLLERVESRQRVPQYGASLHGGAPDSYVYGARTPDLAPTGAGSILAAFAMAAALGWTMRRAKRAEEAGIKLMRGRK